ncbi:nucleoside triphosphate pyrophosphohydrolase family protein [Natronorubrum daqingense]|uniref:Uncharacterized protein n=1 Tax=Natronorubrum daqingense TaxID=588898 RepID=A0A1N7G246_9EURY|nr:hypothetical protein [Natronorubrum daqingense]APX98652.1 hypothetical protein BB347_18350 [Natronorubrum daqingense]SIS06700.1 hypothetical protein SAMN05421809_3688 [Natronorubrum daqingense]
MSTGNASSGTERCIGCGSEIEGDGFYGQGDVKPEGLEGLGDGESVPVSELFGFNDGPYCTLECSLEADTDSDDDLEIRADGGTSSSGTGRKEVLRGAVEVWGEDLQIQIAIEELSELTTELARRQRGRESYSATVEEIADVQLCLDQLKLMYNPEQVEMAEQDKLERLKRRVERDRDE